MLDAQQLCAQFQQLGLSNTIITVHSAARAFGPLKNGVDDVIDALLAINCTLVVPVFRYDTVANPPADKDYPRNGKDGDWTFDSPQPFDADDNQLEACMGRLPKAVLARAERERSIHPINSFAAIGPHAKTLMQAQRYDDVYAPFRLMPTLASSKLLLVGVDFSAATVLHYAELLAGRRMFKRFAMDKQRQIVEVDAGGCSNGFAQLQPYVAAQTLDINQQQWQLYDLPLLVQQATQLIQQQPQITACSPQCARCRDAIAGGPLLTPQA